MSSADKPGKPDQLHGMPILFREQPAEQDDLNFVHVSMTKCGTCAHGICRVLQQRIARPKKGAEPISEGSVFGGPQYAREDYDLIDRRWIDVYCGHPCMQDGGGTCHRVPELVVVCQGWEERKVPGVGDTAS